MPEEILEFENTVEDESGLSHRAVVLAEERDDGRWIGRIRFIPADGTAPIETERETTQPKRSFVVYWAGGLTYFYLEGALARARRRTAGDVATARKPGAAGPPSSELAPAQPSNDVPRLEVRALDPAIVATVMGVRDPQPGTARQVPDAGIIVYEGTGGDDGASHLFAIQFGSTNAGAVLINWLWSRLHHAGATVRVGGRPVELTNDALKRALTG